MVAVGGPVLFGQDGVDEALAQGAGHGLALHAVDLGDAVGEHDDTGQEQEAAHDADGQLRAEHFAERAGEPIAEPAGGEVSGGGAAEGGDVGDGHDASAHGVGDDALHGGPGLIEAPDPEDAADEHDDRTGPERGGKGEGGDGHAAASDGHGDEVVLGVPRRDAAEEEAAADCAEAEQ